MQWCVLYVLAKKAQHGSNTNSKGSNNFVYKRNNKDLALDILDNNISICKGNLGMKGVAKGNILYYRMRFCPSIASVDRGNIGF